MSKLLDNIGKTNEKDLKCILPDGGALVHPPHGGTLIPGLFEHAHVGDAIESLPADENPFTKDINEINKLKADIKEVAENNPIIGSTTMMYRQLEELQSNLSSKMIDYAQQNPDTVFATAFATDNPHTNFAQQHPDLVLTGEAKDEFIKENLKEGQGLLDNLNNAIGNVLGVLRENSKFRTEYGSGDRSDELKSLTNAMDKAVRNDEAIVIQMQNGSQVLLDPTKEGGLNMYSIDGDKTKLIASFDENGKDLLGNAQNTLAQIANHMEIDNDGLFGNLEDMRRDSLTKEQQNSKPIDELKPRPLKLEDFFKNNDGQSL